MQFGLAIPTYRISNGAAYMTELAQAAEELGYESIWFADHLAIPESHEDYLGTQWYEPVITASYLAAKTKRVKLGWDVLIIPYRNPLILAKMVATLDSLCGGRVIFAGAAGYVEGEFAGLGLDFHRRGEMSDEFLKIYRELWTQEDPAFDGKYYRFSDVKSSPKPLQRPHPPMWIGGHSQAAICRAALLGNGWHPLHPSAEEIRAGIATIKALRGSETLDDFTISYSSSHILFDGDLAEADLPERMRSSPFRGAPDHIAGAFTSLAQAGVQHATIRFPHHLMTQAGMLRAMERFMKEVAPQVP